MEDVRILSKSRIPTQKQAIFKSKNVNSGDNKNSFLKKVLIRRKLVEYPFM